MANDCLVTKLKGTVDNPNLRKLGAMRWQVSQKTITDVSQQRFTLRASEEVVVSVVGTTPRLSETSAGLETPVLSITIPADTAKTVWMQNADYEIEISNKYALTQINVQGDVQNKIFGADLSELEYCTKLVILNIDNCQFSGDIAYLNKLGGTLESLTLTRNTGVIGDVSNLSNLKRVANAKVGITGITGKVEGVAGMSLLGEIWLQNTVVSGRLEDLANAMLPKASGAVRVICNLYITVNGTVVGPDQKYIYFGSSMSGHNPTEAETAQGWCIR